MNNDERIDKVLNEMANTGNGRLNIQNYLQEKVKDNDLNSYQRVSIAIEDQGFARRINIGLYVILTKGREVVESGGYIKYKQASEAKRLEKERIMKISDEDTLQKYLLNKFYYKHRLLPFIFSALALAISIISILIAIFK